MTELKVDQMAATMLSDQLLDTCNENGETNVLSKFAGALLATMALYTMILAFHSTDDGYAHNRGALLEMWNGILKDANALSLEDLQQIRMNWAIAESQNTEQAGVSH